MEQRRGTDGKEYAFKWEEKEINRIGKVGHRNCYLLYESRVSQG